MVKARLQRNLGLGSAVLLIIGNVIGASIFVLPGGLAGLTGPALFIAYLIASVPALLNCIIAAQVGTTFPISGSPYVITARVLHPLAGFLMVWSNLIVLVVALPLLAKGFANYFMYFVPQSNAFIVSLCLIAFLTIINCIGIRSALWSQSVMVAGVLLVLGIFCIAGVGAADWSRLTPLVPNGPFSVLQAAVPAYFSFFGFVALAFMAEEVKNPQKNIPLALGISFALVTSLYAIIAIVTLTVLPLEQIAESSAPLADAAATFMPVSFANVLAIAALLATVTTVNGIFLMSSRSILALGRDQVLPAVFALADKRSGQPVFAVLLVTCLALVGLLVGGSLADYARVSVVSFMLFGAVWSVALLMLPSKLPDRFAASKFRLPMHILWGVVILKIATSVLFGFLAIQGSLMLSLQFLTAILLGGAYYFIRKIQLRARGLDIDELIKSES